MTAAEKRKVKWLREYLVRHGNYADFLKDGNFTTLKHFGVTRKMVERGRKKIWKKLMAADPRLLKIAADELNERELRWR